MGTNFYILGSDGKESTHIGKRSAAGYFCFDCQEPLNNMGLSGVHNGRSIPLDHCPVCGKKKEVEPLDKSSAGLELGFNKDPFQQKIGIKTVSSFTFAISMDELRDRLSSRRMFIQCVVDEYGRRYTYPQFKKILDACPIQYDHMIGQSFS